jgi:hypothetical protein
MSLVLIRTYFIAVSDILFNMLTEHLSGDLLVRMQARDIAIEGGVVLADHDSRNGEVSNSDGLVNSLCVCCSVAHIVFVLTVGRIGEGFNRIYDPAPGLLFGLEAAGEFEAGLAVSQIRVVGKKLALDEAD